LRWFQPFSMVIWQSPRPTTLSSQFELDTICYQHSSFPVSSLLFISLTNKRSQQTDTNNSNS
jgi:hypothetical protein